MFADPPSDLNVRRRKREKKIHVFIWQAKLLVFEKCKSTVLHASCCVGRKTVMTR
jgi:hypothetical protein